MAVRGYEIEKSMWTQQSETLCEYKYHGGGVVSGDHHWGSILEFMCREVKKWILCEQTFNSLSFPYQKQRLHTGEEPTECHKYEEISHRTQLSRHMSGLSQDRNPMLAINLEEPSAFIHHWINIS